MELLNGIKEMIILEKRFENSLLPKFRVFICVRFLSWVPFPRRCPLGFPLPLAPPSLPHASFITHSPARRPPPPPCPQPYPSVASEGRFCARKKMAEIQSRLSEHSAISFSLVFIFVKRLSFRFRCTDRLFDVMPSPLSVANESNCPEDSR